MFTSAGLWGDNQWGLGSYAPPRKRRKGLAMRPARHAGSRVGTLGLANRSGGKHRGVKAGRHAGEKRVNVRKLAGAGHGG